MRANMGRRAGRTHNGLTRFSIDTGRLAPGPHRLVVTARDAAGNLGRRSATFRVCARR